MTELTRGQRLYRAYLKASDVFRSLTFKEFLTSEFFAEARKKARTPTLDTQTEVE